MLEQILIKISRIPHSEQHAGIFGFKKEHPVSDAVCGVMI